jgi:hypothetical protein
MIDRAHWNRSSVDPRFEGLHQLLAWDGYQVSRNRQEFVPELLRGARVLIVADALGWKGAMQPAAGKLGLHLQPEAFSQPEVGAVHDWVIRGGSLLLVADRSPAGPASQALANAFGVQLADCPSSCGVTAVRFDRREGLGDDPISEGRPEAGEQVYRAMGFGGCDVSGPPGSMAFLRAGATGKPQGIAFEPSRGRVVVLTAQLARDEKLLQRAGIDDRLTDNRQLILNIVHWLSRTP